MRLPGISVTNWSTTQRAGGGVPLMSTRVAPAVCTAELEMPASFVVTFCRRGPCFSSTSQITVDRYRSGRIGIGGDTQSDISYSPML